MAQQVSRLWSESAFTKVIRSPWRRVMWPARFEPAVSLFPSLLYICITWGPLQGAGVSVRVWILNFWQIHSACCDLSFSILPYLSAGALWRTSVLLGETDYNQRSGNQATTVTDPIIKARTKGFSQTIYNAEFTPKYGFPFHTFYVLKEPFTNLAVGESSCGSCMNSSAQCVLPYHSFMFKGALGQNEILSTLLGKIIRIL